MKESKLKKFLSIFKDDNTWNEKTIIGFISFVVMCLFAIFDIFTGYLGKEFKVNEFIYDSFMYITLGCLGIDGIQRFSKK